MNNPASLSKDDKEINFGANPFPY